jgi:hypothetical protein
MRIKLVISEQPRTTHPLMMFARKNGRYVRPIRGDAMDVRMEDMGELQNAARSKKFINYILPLPPIADQAGKFGVMNFGFLDKIIGDGPELQALIASNKYFVFPDSPQSEFWQFTQRPWWEFAEVLDEHGGVIKAPLVPRPGEFTAEEIDERLDEYEENRGKAEVLSPLTLEKMLAGTVKESYLKKLKRI